jgi:hypothetical protein
VSFAVACPESFPAVFGVYRCRCGAQSVRYGVHVSVPPSGWVEQPRRGDEPPDHFCPRCAARARQLEASSPDG